MNRRDFLNRAMIATGLLVVDPERLLWTPGKKTIFIPAVVEPVMWWRNCTTIYYNREALDNLRKAFGYV